MTRQLPIRFVLMRGGTSKAVFLRESDLPAERAARDRVILSLFGSPDPRQIDGLGGADILTSKLAIIGPPTREDADVDYTFAQISVSEPHVSYDINCGNISSAVGTYAVEEGFVRPDGDTVSVRIHNTNTHSVFVADVPLEGGEPAVEGELVVDGVPGTGAPILLDFSPTVGGATGSLFPTGSVADTLDVVGVGQVAASVVDIGNLSVFFEAGALGLAGTELPGELAAETLRAFDAVKDAAARLIGLAEGGLVPVPVAVSPPAAYVALGGSPVAAADASLVARVVGGRPPSPHKAYPGTVGVATAVAALVPGTVVAAIAALPPAGDPVTIGHPSGVLPIWARVREAAGGGWDVDQAAYARTARRLAEGTAYVRRSAWPA